MPRRPATADTTPATVHLATDALAVELGANALREAADQRRRAGVKISGELAEKRAAEGADIRTGALLVVTVLSEADALNRLAEELEQAWEFRDVDPSPLEVLGVLEGIARSAVEEEPHEVLGTVGADGSISHGDDPDVSAARAALGLVPPPAPGFEDDDGDDAAGMSTGGE